MIRKMLTVECCVATIYRDHLIKKDPLSNRFLLGVIVAIRELNLALVCPENYICSTNQSTTYTRDYLHIILSITKFCQGCTDK